MMKNVSFSKFLPTISSKWKKQNVLSTDITNIFQKGMINTFMWDSVYNLIVEVTRLSVGLLTGQV
jgi:hypothetical protein